MSLGFFSKNVDVLIALMEKLEEVDIDISVILSKSSKYCKGRTSALHLLSQKELENNLCLKWMMILLQRGFPPNLRDGSGKTFLEVSNIKNLLQEHFKESPDVWASDVFKSWDDKNN